VNRSYRPGILIVAGTVLASALACAALVSDRPAAPAGESLEPHPWPLGDFRLTERSGRAVGPDDLAGDVWVAAFIYTRCPSVCPRITAKMVDLGRDLRDTGVRLVSLSVDPAHDTPEVLSEFASRYRADPDRWWFLTGPPDEVRDLIATRFHLPVADRPEDDPARAADPIAHSPLLALVDRGNRVVGVFDSNDAAALARLRSRARRLDDVRAAVLPGVNAALNGTCAVLLVAGLGLIRSGRVRPHAACMVAALAVSALFLSCYLYYHFVVAKGGVPFQGVGKPARVAYFTILLSHTVLAVVDLPLIVGTVALAWRRRFDRHARWARVTFPIWLYVSITGVVVYWMLYRLDLSGIAASPR
jgi:protein SCO1/2/putative membrane protein